MIPYGSAIANLFEARRFSRAEVCRIFLVGETTPIRLTTSDYRVVAPGGEVFAPGWPLMSRGDIVREFGLKSQTMQLNLTPRDDDQLYGRSWKTCLRDGIFDGAKVEYLFAFTPLGDPSDASGGLLPMFEGEIGDAYPKGLRLVFECNDPTKVLETPYPLQVYQTQCANVLFDRRCGLDADDFVDPETVNSGASVTTIPITNARPAGYYNLGQVRFTSGPCWGIRRSIRSWNGSSLTLVSALPRAPGTGSTMQLWPGCPRTRAGCDALGNDRYRGFPFIPKAETAV